MAPIKIPFISNLFEKLKKIKHIEIYAVVILAVLVIIIWFWPGDKAKSNGDYNIISGQLTTTESYAKSLEDRLKSVLSNIAGAGEVSVMVTLDGEIERVIAYATDEKTNTTSNTSSSGNVNKTETVTSSTEPIIITANGSSEPLVLKEIMPGVLGVVIVASGANNVRVKLDILKAIQALLKIDSGQIEIFVKNQ